MTNRSMRGRVVPLVAAAGMAGSATAGVGPATSAWMAPVSGSWNDPTLWTPLGVPASDGTGHVLISAAGAPYIVTSEAINTLHLTIDSSDVTLFSMGSSISVLDSFRILEGSLHLTGCSIGPFGAGTMSNAGSMLLENSTQVDLSLIQLGTLTIGSGPVFF